MTANLLAGLNIDEFLSRTDAGGARHFLSDALGSTLALTDSTGIVRTQYTYDPYGNTTRTGSSSSNSYQYTGRENDQTGLYYYRARFYGPATGRFISEDPIGNSAEYAYAQNDPVGLTDPMGLLSVVPVGGSGRLIGRPEIPPVMPPITWRRCPFCGPSPTSGFTPPTISTTTITGTIPPPPYLTCPDNTPLSISDPRYLRPPAPARGISKQVPSP